MNLEPGPVNIVFPFASLTAAEDCLTRIELSQPVKGFLTDQRLHELPGRDTELTNTEPPLLAVGTLVEVDNPRSTFHGREGEIVELLPTIGQMLVRFAGSCGSIAFGRGELRPAWSSRASLA